MKESIKTQTDKDLKVSGVIKLKLYMVGDYIYLKYWVQGSLHVSNLFLDKKEVDTDQYIFFWLAYQSSKMLKEMPFNSIEIDLDRHLYAKYPAATEIYTNVILATNNYIKENQKLKGCAKEWEVLYFLGSSNHRYISLSKWIEKEIPESIYRPFETGFDGKTRTWTKETDTISVNEVVELIVRNKIGQVAAINYEVIAKFATENKILLCTLLEFMGVDLIIINNDPSDLTSYGAIQRAAFDTKFRYSNMGIISECWDEYYGKEPVYIPIPQRYEKENRPSIKINDDYKVVIISNSRWETFKPWEIPVLSVLDNMQNPLTDLSIWYMAMHTLVKESDEREYKHSRVMRNIHLIFYMAAQYMKYQILENIKAERMVEVYGDEGWKNICKENYKGFLNKEEMIEMYKSGNNLYLLVNYGFTYLDHSGPVYDMIKYNVPWINVPVIAKTKELVGLRRLEYKTYGELNTLIKDAVQPLNNARQSLNNLNQLYYSSTVNMIGQFKQRQRKQGMDDCFTSSYNDHKTLVSKEVSNYIENNEQFLQRCQESISAILLS